MFFLLLFFSLLTISFNNNAASREATIQEAEKFSAGKLSDKNELFVRSVIEQTQCSNTTIEFRKPIKELLDTYPLYIFGHYVAPYNYWYINEPWFDGLTDNAKKFYIGYQLIAAQPAGIKDKLPNIMVWIIELSVLVGLFLYLRSKPKWYTINLTTYRRIGLAVLGTFIISVPLELLETKYFIKKPVDTWLAHDITVVRKLNCVDGALELLKNQQQIIAPTYEHNKAYWKDLYESFPARIAQLEKLKNVA